MPRGVPKEFEPSDWAEEFVGRYFRRKRGEVVYKVVGGFADHSYEAAYNFVRPFVWLEREMDGSAKRPAGSRTLVPEDEFRYSFEEDRELLVYELQDKWIRENVGEEAAKSANYGWGVDQVHGYTVSTKVYGDEGGVLTTDAETLDHNWEPW